MGYADYSMTYVRDLTREKRRELSGLTAAGWPTFRDRMRYAEWVSRGKRPSAKPTLHFSAPDPRDRYSPKRSASLSRKYRAIVAKAQADICALCGGAMARDANLAKTPGSRISLDHVTPLALGGLDGLGNIVAAHRGCN